MKKTIGGDRLGAGKKMKVDLKHYNRSNHNLDEILRTTMSAGTLVPFLKKVALPGDTFDIDLDVDVKTHPTIGPLFGSYKIQLDVFLAPIRLYQGDLHNNALNIGMNMANIRLPRLRIYHENEPEVTTVDLDNAQMNPSCIFSYLGIRGLGRRNPDNNGAYYREFNAVPYLAYWDIYKNYYANKQEEVGAVIHQPTMTITKTITTATVWDTTIEEGSELPKDEGDTFYTTDRYNISFAYTGTTEPNPESILLNVGNGGYVKLTEAYNIWFTSEIAGITYLHAAMPNGHYAISSWSYIDERTTLLEKPTVETFPLANIDEMRNDILRNAGEPIGQPVIIGQNAIAPYGLPQTKIGKIRAKQFSQEGLALKTYQSDLFNNWMSTEWIDGDNGINAITAIDTSAGQIEVNAILLAKKVYDMLNRIAISGGSYRDWLETVWDHKATRDIESPTYVGGLIRELVFQEVVSNSAAETSDGSQPLGELAGKGIMAGNRKGGHITVKVNEPSYIMGIVSLTPRVDYSQGNEWDTGLMTMDDFHKPALDEIGFQDLITDQMAWWDTEVSSSGALTFQSAGKQPAWVNYMTSVNKVLGNFAIESQQMFMTLNRRYEPTSDNTSIADLTTYIDPAKFNHIFADTARDAQNFWVQIATDIKTRRKMSAKIMPNL